MEAVEREEPVLAVHEVLPLEVMQHIMGLADPASVARAEGVCRAWRSACESPFVWEAVFRRHFSSRPSPAAKEKWRTRCVKAAISLRRLQALESERRLPDTLKWCAACGHDRVLRELLTKEAAHMTLHLLNGGHPPGYSSNGPSAVPLHLAAAVGCAEVVDLLALAGADVNVTNGRGDTPVGIAAAKGFLDVVEVLLRHGAGGSDFARLIEAQQTASNSNRKSAPPLSFQAAAGGHIKIMEVLMEKAGGPEKARALVNAAERKNGKTALHFAAENGHCAMVAFLLKHGADKNALNVTKQTALHLATLAGCLPTVRMLVEHGAQILFTAAEVKSSKVPVSPLHLAAASHSEALVSLFVELGLDINLTDAAGRIPLHCAARAAPKNAGFIEFLLARGANAKAVDEEGQGVLHYAITVRTNDESVEMVEMCRRLIAAGADVHFNDPILGLAKILLRHGEPSYSVDLVNLFVEHGLNIKDPRIGTALLTAAAGAFSYDLAVVLLDHGVDPNASVGPEALPLHQVVFRRNGQHTNRRRIVELLLERGADPNIPAGHGRYPALFSSDPDDDIFDLLLSRGADINARTGHGENFLFSTISRSWPSNESDLDSLRKNVVALIERGADPGQCRVDGHGPVSEVGVDPTDTLVWELIAFLRSVGIPIQTADDDDEPGEAGHHHDDPASPGDGGEEGMAEPLGHNDDGDANEDEPTANHY